LRIYVVSVCMFFLVAGRGFQTGHMNFVFFIQRNSPPHLWNCKKPIPPKISQFTGTIQNPKTAVSSVPFESAGWPLQKLIVHQTYNNSLKGIIAASVVLGIYVYICMYCIFVIFTIFYLHIPVAPHKAVVEVLKIGHYRRGELLWCMDGTAKSTGGPKSGWSCVFWSGCNGCSGHLTRNCWM